MAGRKTKETNSPTPPELRPRSAPIIERAPLPIVEVQGSTHLVSYVNAAFCSLVEKSRTELVGKPFCEIVPKGHECMEVLDRVFQTGEAATLAQEDDSEPAHWLYAMWPALGETECPVGVIIQLTKTVRLHQNLAEINEALLLSGLRQHEMTHEAEQLNRKLLNEIAVRKNSEEALRESEEFNRSIILSSPDCIKILSLKGDLISFLQGAEELLGIEDFEPYLNKSWLKFWVGEDRQAATEAVEEAAAGEQGHFVGFFRTLRDEPKWWDVSVSPILDKSGKPYRLLAVSRDVTKRRQAEDSLRRSEKHTQSARDYAEATLRTAPVPLIILRSDLRVNTTNEAFCKTFQVEPGEAEGKLIYELGNGQWDIPELRELLEEILPKNKVFNNYEVTHDFENIGHRTMLLNARRLENETGEPLRIVLAIEDITARKMVENALRESEGRYRTLFNSIDEGFCIIELIYDEKKKPVDWRFLETNPSFNKQTGLSGVLGRRVREFAPDHEDYWFEIYDKVARTGEPARFINEAKAMSRWFDHYAFRVGNEHSRKVAILFNDITERRLNELALRKAKVKLDEYAAKLELLVEERTHALQKTNEQLEAFVYSIAHDLRAPLRSMQGFSQLLLEDYGKAGSTLDETGTNYLNRINSSAMFMDKMIMDLLAYGGSSSLRKESELESVSVQEAWESALFQYASVIEKTNAQIETVTPLPMVRAHAATLSQVLANLLSNSLKFVEQGQTAKIRFRAEDFGKNVRLWVEDNGLGIEPQHHQRIYRVFERLHGARFSGTGIGLSIVRKGIDRMGGLLGLDSAPGKGSRFCIELPKA